MWNKFKHRNNVEQIQTTTQRGTNTNTKNTETMWNKSKHQNNVEQVQTPKQYGTSTNTKTMFNKYKLKQCGT